MKRSPLKRGKGIKPMSTKTASEASLRKQLRLEYLAIHPHCEMCRKAQATDIDEIISRGTRPGAHLVPALFQALCRPCHTLKTAHPNWAYRHGWSAHPWDEDRIDVIRASRSRCAVICEQDHVPPLGDRDDRAD